MSDRTVGGVGSGAVVLPVAFIVVGTVVVVISVRVVGGNVAAGISVDKLAGGPMSSSVCWTI